MSPGSYMPISRTATSSVGDSRSNVSGSPISLFSLALLRSTCQRVASTSAVCSLVDVLASDPVTPTTSGSNRSRHAPAARRRASSGSSTTTTATPGLPSSPSSASSAASSSVDGGCATTRAAAPARAASTTKRCPSVRSPCSAKNALPCATRRESTAPPLIGTSPERSSTPPTAAASDSESKEGSAEIGRAATAGHSRI